MIVLGTNVISELRKKPHHQDPKVCAWSQTQSASVFYLTTLTLMEIERGRQNVANRTLAAFTRLILRTSSIICEENFTSKRWGNDAPSAVIKCETLTGKVNSPD
jgi:predicted nucleic acid-binding protein